MKPHPAPPPAAAINVYKDTNLLTPIKSTVSGVNVRVTIQADLREPEFRFGDDVTHLLVPATWDLLAVETTGTVTREMRVIVSDKRYV